MFIVEEFDPGTLFIIINSWMNIFMEIDYTICLLSFPTIVNISNMSEVH